MKTYSRFSSWWKGFRRKNLVLGLLLLLIIIVLSGAIARNNKDIPTSIEDTRPSVKVETFRNLSNSATITRSAPLELAGSALLIARSGGRVTNITAKISDQVASGQLIIEVDGGVEANPTAVGAAGASRSLAIFSSIEKQAVAATDNAIEIAQLNLNAASAGRKITTDLQNKLVDTAKQGVAQAEAQVAVTSDTKEQAIGTNDLGTLINAANVGVEAAKLARDQAALSRTLTNRQTSDAVQQARRALTSAQIGKQRALADLTSQRTALETQAAVAAEQARASQVISPVSGSLTSLTVRIGDYLTPGQQIGEILGTQNGLLRTEIPAGARNSINIGQKLPVISARNNYTGVVLAIAPFPSSETLLYQVDIAIKETIHEGDLHKIARIEFPVLTAKASTSLIPLDAINVRQSGPVIFTLSENGTVVEHALDIIDYQGDFAESRIVFPDSTLIVVEGNRTLSDGDEVALAS